MISARKDDDAIWSLCMAHAYHKAPARASKYAAVKGPVISDQGSAELEC